MGAALCQSLAGERDVTRATAPLPAPGVQPRCLAGAPRWQWHLNWAPRALAAAITAFGSASLSCCIRTFQGSGAMAVLEQEGRDGCTAGGPGLCPG